MEKRPVAPLICPVCEAQLAQVGQTLKCPQAHSFDVAREGYVNLWLARRKKPAILGDTKKMLQARRNFLDRGHYGLLSDAINERVYDHLVDNLGRRDESFPAYVAEIGCGEGYYVGRLKHHLDSQLDIHYFGMDISKDAAGLASKRYKDIRFIVASTKQKILFANDSIQVLLNIFAPRNAAEFDRVMAKAGILIVVIPNPDHLADLPSSLMRLGIEPDKERRVVEQFAGMFRLAEKQTIEYEMYLNGGELLDLMRMTPHYWHMAEEARGSVGDTESVCAQASFTILEFHK
jgi:23S rRNA (guanine745-N1)-methyltransferase